MLADSNKFRKVKPKRKKIIRKLILLLVLVIVFKNCVSFDAPKRGTAIEINNLSFWLDKINDPDKVILSRYQINKLNRKINKDKYMGRPLSENSRRRGYIVRKMILRDLYWMYKLKKYDVNNKRIYNKEFKKRILPLLALYRIPKKVKIRFCLVTRPTYLRAFPTGFMVMSKPDDIAFDNLQKSFLDIGEPLALLHISRDKKWGFVLSTHSHGWVRLKHIAWTYNKNIVKEYNYPSSFIVALDWEVPIYTDEDFSVVCSVMHMGTRIPLIEKKATNLTVKIPVRDQKGRLIFRKGYIENTQAVSMNYLRMTPRNIAKQSFRMLGQPYSWGGRNFNTDCSYFIKVIFQSMGLNLPRNSYAQIKSLKNFKIYQKNKKQILNTMVPFRTLFYHSDPGHIMLYIGKLENQYYVIHNKWSYKTLIGKKEKEVFLKKALVSNLSLGKNSNGGSLFKKISRIGVLQ